MARRKKKIINKKDRNNELDITSLLDILVILLVFLLKSYNASELKVNLAKKMTLPVSESRDLGHQHVLIQVNGEGELFMNNEKLGLVNSRSPESIAFLSKELLKVKKKIEQERGIASVDMSEKELEENSKVNILFDQETPYEVMNKVMNTTAENGFAHFKFIVRGNY